MAENASSYLSMTCPSPNSPWKNARRIAWHEPPARGTTGRQPGWHVLGRASSARSSRRTSLGLLATILFLATWRIAGGDQIVVRGENHADVEIVGLEEGNLCFLDGRGRTHRAPLSALELIVVSRGTTFDDFNEAERFLAGGETEKAAARYERAARLAGEFWSDLVACRLTVAYDRANQFDRAMVAFVRALRGRTSGASAAVQIIPRNMPTVRTAAYGRAVGELEAALSVDVPPDQRALLELVGFDVLRKASDDRTAQAAARVAAMHVPRSIRSPAVYAIVAEAMRRSIAADANQTVLDALDEAIRQAPDASVADFLLLKGDALSKNARTRDDLIRASWPYLRVVVHLPDDSRAADGLLGAAKVLSRLGRDEPAAALLKECALHRVARPEIRQQAEQLLARAATETRPKP